MKLYKSSTVLALCVSMPSLFAIGFNDTFDSIDPAWVTDRYEPAGFTSAFFDGDDRLKIDIDTDDGPGARPGSYASAFYNTQGRQREALITGAWSLSADLYVSSDMVDGSSLRRTDIWARTGSVGTETGADYPIFGVAQFDPTDAFNPSAPGIVSMWRVWDPNTGNWVVLGDTVTEGWHTLEVVSIGGSYQYLLDGALVYSDLTTQSPESLTTAFVEAYNFGNEDYSVYWDNISVGSASVPEAGSTLALLGFGFLALGSLRRRMKA